MTQMSKHHRPAFVFRQFTSGSVGLPVRLMLIAVTAVAILAASSGSALGETWTDNTGQFKVEAQFLVLKANQVYLKKENGVVIKVPLERLSPESQQLARKLAAPPAAAADTPDGSIRTVVVGLEQGNLRVAWDALPPSYQSDVNDLVHTFAENMDVQLWNAGTGILKKAVQILKEKKEFILAHPKLQETPVDPKIVSENWDTVVALLDSIVNSELTDLEKLKTLDVGAFLSGTGKTIADRIMAIAAIMKDQDFGMADFPGVEVDPSDLASLKDAKITMLNVDGDTATVRIEKEGGESEDVQMVRVEGKWLPKEMVDGWAAGIAEAKTALTTEMGPQLKQNKQMVLFPMNAVGAILDKILATQTQEEFNQVIEDTLKNLPGMGGGGAAPFGGGANPFGSGAGEASADPFGN